MFNLLLPVLLASTPSGLLDCKTYEWLMEDLKFPDVSEVMKEDIKQTIADGTDPACFE